MKLNIIQFNYLSFLFALCLIFTGCNKNDDDVPDNLVQFSNISINGAEEVPPNNSTATGVFNGTYDRNTKILSYNLTFAGIEPTNMHFHKGAPGVNGGVEIGISEAPFSSPINSATPALTDEQEMDLLEGNWYVNIHSAEFPAGEIRGQLIY
jgi:hypothetical protein